MLRSAALAVLLLSAPCLAQPREAETVQVVQGLEGVRGDKMAVIVGIDDYKDPTIRDLRFSSGDARAVYEVLTDPQRGAFPPDKVCLMTDGSPADRAPTRRNVLIRLSAMCQSAQADDTILFYFCGHGMPAALIAKDTELELPEDTGVSLSRVEQLLRGSAARRQVVIYDCSHAGGLRVGAMDAGTMDPLLQQQLLAPADGRVVLSSCSGGEVGWEWPERGHGVFTVYLLEAFDQGDANGDGVVTATEAGEYVIDKVKVWAIREGRPQRPRLERNDSGPIALAVAKGRPAPPATTTATLTVSGSPEGGGGVGQRTAGRSGAVRHDRGPQRATGVRR